MTDRQNNLHDQNEGEDFALMTLMVLVHLLHHVAPPPSTQHNNVAAAVTLELLNLS